VSRAPGTVMQQAGTVHSIEEYLNGELKRELRQRPQPDGKDELIRNARSVLRAIQRSPERVRAFFSPQPVRYAA